MVTKKDIFAGKFGCTLVFILVAVFVIFDFFTDNNVSNMAWIVFFFLIGALCLYNYNGCGRYHCRITGPGFIIVGIIALLSTLGLINVTWNIIWIIFWIFLIIGYGFEFLYKGKKGTCYKSVDK